MRAVQLVAPGLPVENAEVPKPSCGPDQVLVRVRAAGICHSDVHYRAGRSLVEPLPLTLGHEVAGEIVEVGQQVVSHAVGDAVCLHYLVTCGICDSCMSDREMFCASGKMLGHFTDGGWAEYIAVPARNAVSLPYNVSFEHGAVMMCSSATSLHALHRGRLARGETVLVLGAGGLGMSAIQLAFALGAGRVVAVDRDAAKLTLAERFGAVPVNATGLSPEQVAEAVRAAAGGAGVDVAVELVASAETVRAALWSMAPRGRVVIVGLNPSAVPVDTYRELIGREVELIGSNDHLLSELRELVELASIGRLDLREVVTNTVPLDADAINGVLDALDRYQAPVRTVVVP
ncbi:MAG: hypothetical protein RLZZ621_699 [Gemmatimonadota bacterium]